MPWLTKDDLIKYFFGANAWMSIVVLGLIMLSLYSESIGFNPSAGFFGQNYRNLLVYRQAGLEFVDILKKETTKIDDLGKRLADIRLKELKRRLAEGKRKHEAPAETLAKANAALAAFDAYADKLSSTEDPLNAIISPLSDTVTATRDQVAELESKKAEKQLYIDAGKKDLADKVTYQEVDLEAAAKPLRDALPAIKTANDQLAATLLSFAAQPPPRASKLMGLSLAGFEIPGQGFPAKVRALAAAIPRYQHKVETWDPHMPLPWYAGVVDFFFNTNWLTASFFGVAVLGQFLLQLSIWGILPPFSSRLNVITAGILLAFMAVPTIFTLTEDAINNVPRAFKEASYALGATRLQTIWRIVLPASLSGVISAVLLGFGRVIGETMVVLLCAGNSISIPPLSQGLMILFQPVHTMTGIIAQELGEAENGSIEWHALFTVGLLLFVISLVINFLAQRVVKRFKISIG